jgi:hypothetical protein
MAFLVMNAQDIHSNFDLRTLWVVTLCALRPDDRLAEVPLVANYALRLNGLPSCS